ncbi:HNH endonuclease signature motif containing protein [Brachybacterium phenoliresistens]
MSEDRIPGVSDAASRARASAAPGRAPRPASVEAFVAQVPAEIRRGAVRRTVSREALPGRAGVAGDPLLSGVAKAVWDIAAKEGPWLAEKYAALSMLWCGPDEDPEPGLDGDCNALIAAEALRLTESQSVHEIRDAHHAVTNFPSCLVRLEGAQFPAPWFRRMLRMTRRLRELFQRGIDEVVAGWDLHMTPETFARRLRALVAWAETLQQQDEEPFPVERSVTVQEIGEGLSCMTLTGPTPEILSAARRLDIAARAVQAAQRAALQTGGEVPWDPDGTVASAEKPMSLATLRFLLATRAEPDTDGVDVPADRFRVTLTVPVLTMLGVTEAPGMLDGTTPVPAELARALAGREQVWYRVLTDPVTGAFLPLAPGTYRPTAAMQEHLRLRGPQCAVPGCARPASLAAECDHIQEFLAGGATAIENLHWLCWFHHQEKTEGLLDPDRLPPATGAEGATADGTVGPGRTRWLIGNRDGHHAVRDVLDDVDLIGTMTVKVLEQHFLHHAHALCDADCRHFGRPIPEDDEPDDPPPGADGPGDGPRPGSDDDDVGGGGGDGAGGCPGPDPGAGGGGPGQVTPASHGARAP